MKKKQLRILVAPLDWGLGHLTRCLPIIQHIIYLGHQVVFAGNRSQQQYIQSVFPKLEMLHLDGYNVRYAKTKIGLLPKVISQIPRLKTCIKNEHQWLKTIIHTCKIDAVISDNRYGLYSEHIPCVFMTHQLQIRSGLGAYFDKMLRKIHYRFIEKYSSCWVVDIAEKLGLSGSLAHPSQMPRIRTTYIGLLSQCAERVAKNALQEDEYVLILLSGTEPQRSILSDMLWKKAIKTDRHIIFVEGVEHLSSRATIPDHISYHQRLSADELVLALNAASIVICRSGYSSLMDLIALNKKAILIPTPGQTEQEYLAWLMHDQGIFMKADQQKFDIQTSLINASLFPFSTHTLHQSFNLYRSVVEQWVNEIGSR